jgi:hypothetical protein
MPFPAKEAFAMAETETDGAWHKKNNFTDLFEYLKGWPCRIWGPFPAVRSYASAGKPACRVSAPIRGPGRFFKCNSGTSG